MHIEATHYSHRLNHRRSGTIGPSIENQIPRPSSWSSNSVKSRVGRKLPNAHSQILHSSLVTYAHAPMSSPVNEFSPHNQPIDQSYLTVSEDQRRLFFPGSYETQNPSDYNYSFGLSSSFMDQQHTYFYRRNNDTNGPDPLPLHVASKLKQRFEKRVLHQDHHRPSQSRARNFSSDLKCQESWSGSVPSFIQQKPEKYQLVAAFLVDKGMVEAWHIYAPLPVDMGQSSEECVGTRMVELTQRRVRLIQRYYSGARQYVILYVNGNFAEHYLPMGLARDRETSEPFKTKRIKPRKYSNPEAFHRGHRIVSRILSTVRRAQPRSRSVNEVIGPANEYREEPRTRHSETNVTAPSELIMSGSGNGRLRRNQSLPPYSRSDNSCANEDPKSFNPNSSLPSRSVSQPHGSSFIRRVFEHIWSSYSRTHNSKSVNFFTHRNGTSSVRTATENFRSVTDVPVASDKPCTGKRRVDPREKESSSSGLIDFSSSTGSTTSDHLALSQSEVLMTQTTGESRSKTSGWDLAEQEQKRQQRQPQIWLPKNIQSR